MSDARTARGRRGAGVLAFPAPASRGVRTLFEKVWDAHEVRAATEATPAILYVDLHLVHEVTSAQAFAELRERGLAVRRPDRTVATMDHATPTDPRPAPAAVGTRRGGEDDARPGRSGLPLLAVVDEAARAQLDQLASNCAAAGIPLFALGDDRQGIVHVIGPELGLTHPGATVVCGDSHTSTHGAFGALAFGIGTSQVAHVLATQCVLQSRPRTMRIRIDGALQHGVTAKDVILFVIARIGVGGATGHVIEYAGSAIEAMSMESRMTVCNMSIEAGARAGMIAPDDTTIEYIAARPYSPRGRDWDEAVQRWSALHTDDGAPFDTELTIDAGGITPMITYGTNPGMGVSITGAVPDPARLDVAADRDSTARALRYMGLTPGQVLLGTPIDVVFIGSCTNSRLSDLRAAAAMLRGRRVADGVRMLVVPGSQQVKRAAEAELLDEVFRAAGAEWRESGCSMCIAMNGDELRPGQLAVSTSNRNFEGRQGALGRTLLASPLTAAAAAITGCVTDPRTLLAAGAT
ncbi:MAG TPA: 3-isopropylmalate dehydratase large subunit [Gemmatimonadaceae bacterium]|nr:3-isopropylmalate dehydratase large subunit [Gemmatimonadaceae bacterium]